jgi:hypothetical protein
LIVAMFGSMVFTAVACAAEPTLDALSPRISNDCELRASSTDPAETCWTLACSTKPSESLGCGVTAMSQVAEFAVSPDARWLAVVSMGEGHPWLEVVPLKPLLRQHRYRARRHQSLSRHGAFGRLAWRLAGDRKRHADRSRQRATRRDRDAR